MEKKLLEERALKQKVENLLLESEKKCSLLDCDLKQSQQKLGELRTQKEVLSEDVSAGYSGGGASPVTSLSCPSRSPAGL